jgi:hypothetical protein
VRAGKSCTSASTSALGQALESVVRRGALRRNTPVDWVTLLRRSFNVDVLACTKCGGRLRVLGEITEPSLVRLVLETLGLSGETPPVAHARDPTELLGESELL